jgi:hypothetical protein
LMNQAPTKIKNILLQRTCEIPDKITRKESFSLKG